MVGLLRFRTCLPAIVATLGVCCRLTSPLLAEDLPITPNLPPSEFQNRSDVVPSYDFDAPPRGMFRSITLAKGFDEEMAFRRSHEIVPIEPTELFSPDAPAVYVVFGLHQHYQAFQVSGLCFSEQVDGLAAKTLLGQDTMYVALEDESGYVKLMPPAGGWKPGRYKIEIHVGYEINEISLVGTMRFTVAEKG
jgi:hypothetical protein